MPFICAYCREYYFIEPKECKVCGRKVFKGIGKDRRGKKK